MRIAQTLGIAAAGAGAIVARNMLRQRKAISFYDTSVLITGGSRGLGLAREFAAEGANLTIMARDTQEVERAAQQLSAQGAQVLALRDVRDSGIAQEAIDRAVEQYRRVDLRWSYAHRLACQRAVQGPA